MLADFDFDVVYRPGEKYTNADALLRIPMREIHACVECAAVGVDAISLHTQSSWAQAQAQDPATSLVYDRQLHGQRKTSAQEMSSQSREAHTLWSFWDRLFQRDNVLFFQYDDNFPVRLVLPPSCTKDTLRELHQQFGHTGQDKMEKAARKRFWTPNLRQDVRQAVNACSTCQKLKAVRATPRAPLQSIETGYPYQGIDFMGPFTQTRKMNRYLLVMVDFFH